MTPEMAPIADTIIYNNYLRNIRRNERADFRIERRGREEWLQRNENLILELEDTPDPPRPDSGNEVDDAKDGQGADNEKAEMEENLVTEAQGAQRPPAAPSDHSGRGRGNQEDDGHGPDEQKDPEHPFD